MQILLLIGQHYWEVSFDWLVRGAVYCQNLNFHSVNAGVPKRSSFLFLFFLPILFTGISTTVLFLKCHTQVGVRNLSQIPLLCFGWIGPWDWDWVHLLQSKFDLAFKWDFVSILWMTLHIRVENKRLIVLKKFWWRSLISLRSWKYIANNIMQVLGRIWFGFDFWTAENLDHGKKYVFRDYERWWWTIFWRKRIRLSLMFWVMFLNSSSIVELALSTAPIQNGFVGATIKKIDLLFIRYFFVKTSRVQWYY